MTSKEINFSFGVIEDYISKTKWGRQRALPHVLKLKEHVQSATSDFTVTIGKQYKVKTTLICLEFDCCDDTGVPIYKYCLAHRKDTLEVIHSTEYYYVCKDVYYNKKIYVLKEQFNATNFRECEL